MNETVADVNEIIVVKDVVVLKYLEFVVNKEIE